MSNQPEATKKPGDGGTSIPAKTNLRTHNTTKEQIVSMLEQLLLCCNEDVVALEPQYNARSELETIKVSVLGGGVRYVGSLRRGSDGAVGTPDHTEGYWVADAKLGYRVNSNLDLQLNMYNLFDTDYVASINKSGYRYHPGEPRTFMLTANVHF